MKCPYCGQDIEGGSFCPVCGGNVSNVFAQQASNPAPFVSQNTTPLASEQPVEPSVPQYSVNAPMQNDPVQANNPKAKKPGSKKGLKLGLIIGGAVLLLGIIAAVIIIFVLPKDEVSTTDVELTELTSTIEYIASGDTQTALFTVKSSGICDSIALYEDGEEISLMYDDGNNGDAVADDNIYSCQVDISKSVNRTKGITYTSEVADNTSNEVVIYCFAALNESTAMEAKSHYDNLASTIFDLESSYADSTGYVPASSYASLFDDITSELDYYIGEEIVLHYVEEDDSIYVKMMSGLAMVYQPKTADRDAIGDEPANMISLQPCYTDMGGASFGAGFNGFALPEGCPSILDMQDSAARAVSDTLPNFSFKNSNNCNDGEVTLAKIRSIGANQVVLIHTHGYYDFQVKSCLLTGDPFDWDSWYEGGEYYNDCVYNRIINAYLMNNGNAIISRGYIDKYCGDMTNSFIYLAACSSGSSSHLAQSFINKGASAVVANSESILRIYNVAMVYGTVTEMIKVDPETGYFNTLSEALANAMATYGSSDADSRYGGNGAYPIIFGGDNANNYRLAGEVPTGEITGKVCMASDRITPIANATIDVYIDDVLYASTTSDAQGQYSMELPIGLCEIQITANGYIGYSCYADIYAGSDIQIETFLMIVGQAGQIGTASGSVYNSISGQGVGGATLKFLKNWNSSEVFEDVIKTTTTAADGTYTVDLEYGNYTVVVEKSGYTKSSFNIIVQEGETPNQDGVITPEITGDDYLITLTWDEHPRDVDSHLVGYEEDGSSFHVYYGNKTEDGCELDYDDTTSYGPEHITLTADGTQPYYYYLYKYAGEGPLSASGATVTVEQNNVVIAIFHVPTNQGDGDYWNVFCIKDGEIYVENTITDSPDTYYADYY